MSLVECIKIYSMDLTMSGVRHYHWNTMIDEMLYDRWNVIIVICLYHECGCGNAQFDDK